MNYVFSVIGSNISDIYKSGVAGFPFGIRLAYYAGGIWSSILVCRLCFDGNLVYDDNIGSDQPAND